MNNEEFELERVANAPTEEVKFWVVTKATQHSTLDDILFETDPKGMMLQALGGLTPEKVLFVSQDYDDARSFADEQLLRAGKDDWRYYDVNPGKA
jgi:hypothetical protein